MNLIHILAQPVGWGAKAVGTAYDYATPGSGSSTLTNAGSAITDPNRVLSQPGNLVTGGDSWTSVAPTGGGGSGTTATLGASTSNPQPTASGQYSGSGSGSSVVDPAVAAFLDQQIGGVNAQIGALDPQLQVGQGNILSAKNDAINREGTSFAQANRDYGTNRNNTINDEVTAKENIDTGVRQQTNALQRLLGLSGSGNSSASQILAPYAASRQGDVQRQGVQTDYGRNLQSLDTAWGDTEKQHGQNLTDVESTAFQKEQQLEGDIANAKASLLQTLAGLTLQRSQAAGTPLSAATAAAAPYMQQIQDIVSKAAGLGSQYASPISLTAPSVYTAPDLAAYNYDVTAPPVTATQTTTDPNTGQPVLSSLLTAKDKNKLLATA